MFRYLVIAYLLLCSGWAMLPAMGAGYYHDADLDGDVSHDDCAHLQACCLSSEATCVFVHDRMGDGQVTGSDFGMFAGCYTTNGVAPGAECVRAARPFFDVNGDGFGDLFDFYGLADCFNSNGLLCLFVYDVDADADVDLDDYAVFQVALDAGGPGVALPVTDGRSRFGNPFMWTGQRYNPATGLYEFLARSYGPSLGRFLQRDPIGVLDSTGEPYFGGQGTAPDFGPPDVAAQSEYLNSFNLYLYVNASPLNGTDPTGRWDEYDDLIAELTGHKIAALGYIQEAAAATVIGANVAIDIAGALMGVDFFKAFGNIARRKGTVSDWLEIGAATLGTGYVAYKAIKWGRKINKVRKFRNAIEVHHLLPREFEGKFLAAGIQDIDDFVIDLERWRHRLKPHGVHTGSDNWNKRWKQFFKDFEDRRVRPNKDDVLDFLGKLRLEFGV